MIMRAARSIAWAGVAWLATAFSPLAQACDLPPSEPAALASVLDGETLKLADGRTVKLIGAKAADAAARLARR